MAMEQSPYDPAIAQVEAEIQHLQVVLDTLKQLRTRGDSTATPLTPSMMRASGGDADLAHDTFFGMTIGEAAKKYLGIVKATKSTADIASALEEGGLKHASKDFPTTLRSILGPREEFIRVNGDWGLTEWYPGMRKEKKAKPVPPVARKSTTPKRVAGSKKETLEDRILRAMKTLDPTTAWLPKALTEVLGANHGSVQSTLTSMAKSGKILKAEKGYALSVSGQTVV